VEEPCSVLQHTTGLVEQPCSCSRGVLGLRLGFKHEAAGSGSIVGMWEGAAVVASSHDCFDGGGGAVVKARDRMEVSPLVEELRCVICVEEDLSNAS
jgi:hypothetical protein